MYRTTAIRTGLSSLFLSAALVCGLGCGPPETNDPDTGTSPEDTGSPADTGPRADAGDTTTPDAGDTATDPDGGGDTATDSDGGGDTAGGGISELTALEGGNGEFGVSAALEEGYWYSRYNLGSLLMRSGFGETFQPKQEVVQKIKMMVDHKNFDDDKAQPPMNPALMKRVGNSGDAAYSNLENFDDQNPKWNFENYRWKAGGDFETSTKTNPAAFGWTMIKEIEWAKQFHVDEHFGAPTDDRSEIKGAQQRFAGMILTVMAFQQAMTWKNAGDKKFKFGNPGQMYVALGAVSGLADMTLSDFGSSYADDTETNRYNKLGNALQTQMDLPKHPGKIALGGAKKLFGNLPGADKLTGKNLKTQARAAQMLPWFARAVARHGSSEDSQMVDEAKTRFQTLAASIRDADKANSLEHAMSIRVMVEAMRLLGDDSYKQEAVTNWEALKASYDGPNGRFEDVDTYTADDIAYYLGAMSAVLNFGTDLFGPNEFISKGRKGNVETMLTGFFESTINLGGIQQAKINPENFVPKYERQPTIEHVYPSLPHHVKEAKRAPVFAHEIEWQGGDSWENKWKVTDSNFQTAGAMHLANEMIWFHKSEVNGFPKVAAWSN